MAVTRSQSSINVDLNFIDLSYSVQLKDETKQIVGGVSGSVSAGKMLCILGPSGSGKTSLLHILCKKIAAGPNRKIEGSVLCNGVDLTSSQFQRISGLVTQEDVFNGTLSVLETLRFAARLKLPSNQRKERVEEVIRLLQLENCQKTYIGDDSNPYLKGISGGEKRRLAIAVEILDPRISLLVLDEPTSGLDAAAALNVANLLRQLANEGIAVAATLHQPRSSIMARFDQIMVLASGVRVFYGPVADYVPYMEEYLQCQIAKDESPYDLFLDVLNPAIMDGRSKVGVLSDNNDDIAAALAAKYKGSELQQRMDKQDNSPAGNTEELLQERSRGVTRCGKFFTILQRTFLIKMRDPLVLMTQVSSAIMMGLIFGVLYWGCYEKDQNSFIILDTQMAITMTVIMCVFLPYDVTLTFPKERKIFLRERKAGLYCSFEFFIARITADMPMHIIAAIIMAVIIYPMAGLRCGIHLFALVNIAGILVGAAMMQLVGAISRSFEEANLLMMLVMMFTMVMTSGFVREVPGWLVWLREISVMGLLADMAMYLEFRDLDANIGSSEQVFESYGVRIRNDEDMMRSVWILVAIYAVCRLLNYPAVKFLHTGRMFSENLRD